MLVFLAHAALPGFGGGGATGVILFFSLSGFLITGLLFKEHEASGSIHLGKFFARRALRLMPALLTVVLFITAVEILRGGPGALSHAGIALFYLSDIARATGHDVGFLDHTWSLSIEEHFYLLWPALMIVVMSRARNPRAAVGLMALAGALASGVTRWVLLSHGGLPVSDPRVEFGFDTRCDALLLGCAAAALVDRERVASAAWQTLAIGCGVALLLLTTWNAYLTFGVAGIACAVIVPVVWTRPVPLLSSNAMVWIGRRSYAIYLWHVPMFYLLATRVAAGWEWTVVGLCIVAPLSFALAALSYELIERPALRLKARFDARPVTVAATSYAARTS